MDHLSDPSWQLLCERTAQAALHLASAELGRNEVSGAINDATVCRILSETMDVQAAVRAKAAELLGHSIVLGEEDAQFGFLMQKLPELAKTLLDPIRQLLAE